ncbi:PREDICTED: uncharacterized protein LOC109163552 [Ipomoea nil]|uniref:uncharacterized protein LOC109163552 n=1 Tax=Ipomoea nil TaxID=35883 RepID=UPI00090121F3|nr:PREDICTED: uncharacterized protein LOC109163552 [Ipomoea nil]
MSLRLWIVGYDFQCVLHIVCVCLEYRRRNQLPSSPENLNSRRSSGNWSGGNSSSGSDGESGDYGLDTRQNEDADETSTANHLESANTMFSFIWWIIGFYWVSAGGESRSGGEAIRRLKCSQNLEDFQFVDIVIEAILESESVKKKFFVDLDKIVKSSAILTSNTSSISITYLASATNHPTQVIGMPFMNPPPIMKLVEIIRGADTSDETYNVTKNLAEKFGKTVLCSQDYASFIVNRILMPMINEAFYTLYNGVAAKEDIDAGMKFADFIGLDVCLAILKVLHGSLGDTKYAPCPLLVLFVMCGSLGSALQLLAASPYSLSIEKVFVKEGGEMMFRPRMMFRKSFVFKLGM